MGFLRNTIALAFVATLLFYFITLGQLEENQQWIVIGTMVVLGLVILSGSPSFELPAQPDRIQRLYNKKLLLRAKKK